MSQSILPMEILKFLFLSKTEFTFTLFALSLLVCCIIYIPSFNNSNQFKETDEKPSRTSSFTQKIFTQTSKESKLLLFLFLFSAMTLPIIIYMNVGFMGFPDHNTTNEQINSSLYNDKPSQELAMNFFEKLNAKFERENNIVREENDQNKLSQLNKIIEENPENISFLRMSVDYNLEAFEFSKALASQERIIQILGNKTTVSDYSLFLELLVNAARGYVSPKSKRLIDLILKFEANNKTAKLLDGHFFAQSGNLMEAERIWDTIANENMDDKLLIERIKIAKQKYFEGK